jgi:hypothetical protein
MKRDRPLSQILIPPFLRKAEEKKEKKEKKVSGFIFVLFLSLSLFFNSSCRRRKRSWRESGSRAKRRRSHLYQ